MARDTNLPDPKTFTRDELAERWNCELSLINIYIRDGRLRRAVDTYTPHYKYLRQLKYFLCDDADIIYEMVEVLSEKPDRFVFAESKAFKKTLLCPRFLYAYIEDAIKDTFKPNLLNVVKKMLFLDNRNVEYFQNFERILLIPIKVTNERCEIVRVKPPKLEDIIIPLEEIERFEKEQGIGENKQYLPAIGSQDKIAKKEREDADKLSQRTAYGNKPPPAKKIPLTKKEVATRLGISVSHLVNVRKFEDFPKPFPLIRGGKKLGWDEDELEQWIAKERGGENRLTSLKTQTKQKADPEQADE